MKIIPLIALCLISTSLLAQNWQPASITLQDGKTQTGLIDFFDWEKSPSVFKYNDNGRIIEYTGEDVTAFRVGGKNYKLVKAKLKYYHSVPVAQGRSIVAREDSVAVFAEVMFSSAAAELYSLHDANIQERLFVMTDGATRELVKYKVSMERNGGIYNQTNNSYRDALDQIVETCGFKVSRNLAYTTKAIIPVLTSFSICRGEEPTLEEEKQKGLVNLGGRGGVVGASVGGQWTTSPMVGLTVQFLSRRNHNRNFARLEFGLAPNLRKEHFSKGSIVLQGGTYFTMNDLQPLVFMGLSTFSGFHAGAGVAYKKCFVFAGDFKLLGINGGDYAAYTIQVRFYPRLKA